MSEKDETATGNEGLIVLPHHQQLELCRTRPAYRQGRKLTAVKTYSLSSESTHLLIFGVPKINIRQELKSQLRKFGNVLFLVVKNEYPAEEFTECFHVNYDKVQSARIAKKVLDAHSFYGGCLHICYAPELETVDETRSKISQRRSYVYKKLSQMMKSAKHNKNLKESTYSQNYPVNEYNNYSQKVFEEPSSNNYNSKMMNSNLVPYSVINQHPNNGYVNKNITSSCSSITYNANLNKTQLDSDVQSIAGTSSDNIDIGNSNKRKTDEIEYVFKRKRKRKDKTNRLEEQINKLISEKEKLTAVKEPTEDVKVTVYEQADALKVVNLPKKPANKIVLKINTKLI